MKPYTLSIPEDVQRQLDRCRVSLRRSIRARLETIRAEADRPTTFVNPTRDEGPPLRFYVSEGVRVSYQINALTRSVELLTVRAEDS